MMLASSSAFGVEKSRQIGFSRIDQTPNIPEPFKILDWKKIAVGFDRLAFDPNARGEYLPLIWLDDSRVNSDALTFGLASYVGRHDEKPGTHEAICCIAAVLGASLAGIDKTTGDQNWVQMCEAYYRPGHGEGVICNFPAGKSGGSFWYDTFAHVLFYGLVDRYPKTGRLEEIMRSTADRWYEACVALGARDGKLNFDHTGFEFAHMRPHDNGKRTEPEGAAGAAWLQYMAWKKFGEEKHLEGSKWCMDWLLSYPGNPYYEIVLAYAAPLAARMNAEVGTNYDVTKIINWCLGPSTARPGWGVIVGRWGDYEVGGLSGSITDGGGYAFAMNTFVATGAILPTARYDDRYARSLGKWALNAINNARLFYPKEIPAQLQSCPDWKGDPEGVISYEGLRRLGLTYGQHAYRRRHPDFQGHFPPDLEQKWSGIAPFASGDPIPFQWGHKTDFALYGAAHAGIFGAIVGRTDDEHILRLDLLAMDFFHDPAYPTSLLHNPYDHAATVHIDVGDKPVDVYDTVEKRFVATNASGMTPIEIPADSARVIVLAPAGGKRTTQGHKTLVNDVVVDYRVR